jgi:hypothetical protein
MSFTLESFFSSTGTMSGFYFTYLGYLGQCDKYYLSYLPKVAKVTR